MLTAADFFIELLFMTCAKLAHRGSATEFLPAAVVLINAIPVKSAIANRKNNAVSVSKTIASLCYANAPMNISNEYLISQDKAHALSVASIFSNGFIHIKLKTIENPYAVNALRRIHYCF